MHHPFELELSELETINFELEELTDEEAKKVAGGRTFSTLAIGEEGGGRITTMAIGEEGGDYQY
ncbi:hypothetical protein IQ238_00725 [Pleurocapsales cyanobacterium LEGE 06147]|nr:hypothetical protein [Pleurocapsales cyanobacterium LEGE 06147]